MVHHAIQCYTHKGQDAQKGGKSTLIPIYNNKRDIQCCLNYCGIKSHEPYGVTMRKSDKAKTYEYDKSD